MEDRSVTAYLVPLVFPNERRVEGVFCLDEGHHTLTLGYRGDRLQVVIDEDYSRRSAAFARGSKPMEFAHLPTAQKPECVPLGG